MKIAVVQLLSLLLFITGLSAQADEISLEGAYIWILKSPDGNEFVEKIYFKNKIFISFHLTNPFSSITMGKTSKRKQRR